jgi:HEAT repeat protein
MAQLSTEAVPDILRLAEDADAKIKATALAALTVMGDPRIVPMLYRHLADPDSNVSGEALSHLFEYGRKDFEEVKRVYYEGENRSQLLKLARQGRRLAILLIGDVDDKNAISSLKNILDVAKSSPRPPVDRMRGLVWGVPKWSPTTLEIMWDLPSRIQETTLKALFKLQDQETVLEVWAALGNDTATSHTIAIACISHAKRKDMVPELLRLFEDSRDGAQVSLAGRATSPFMKVRDLAALAVINVLQIDGTEFKSTDSLWFEDVELEKLQMAAQDRLRDLEKDRDNP